MWDQFAKMFIYLGMPVVAAYHFIIGNIFLNTSAQDATGLEKAGNLVLMPVHYLLCGKVAVLEDGHYRLVQEFDYNSYWALKTLVSLVSCPVSLPIGCLLKGAAFLTQSTRDRHVRIAQSISSTSVKPNIDFYRRLGIPISSTFELIDPPSYQRRPGEEKKLLLEKELLKQIVALFDENQIPYWVDCGTCLGAYRYGGSIPWDEDADLAILAPDFENALHALNKLDPEKYQVQDWSNRGLPGTYIRVYIKENRNSIDIYHFDIDPENRTLSSICSNENSPFMVESWKIHERRFTIPTSYDTIFPLKKALFDGIEVCVPNQTKLYLQQRYGDNIGPIKIYNEKTDEYEKDLSHPYWQLPHVY